MRIFAENKAWFPALLKNAEGVVVAEGRGRLVEHEDAVNFVSDYVPLYALSTPMEIARMLDGQVIHRFLGKVYLSDRQLMRIVSVTSELLPGAEQVYSDGLSLAALAYPRFLNSPQKKRRLFAPKAPQSYEILIREMSDEKLVFLYDMNTQFSEGDSFWLEPLPPMPHVRIGVSITHAMFFGESASYACEYLCYEQLDKAAVNEFLFARLLKDGSV